MPWPKAVPHYCLEQLRGELVARIDKCCTSETGRWLALRYACLRLRGRIVTDATDHRQAGQDGPQRRGVPVCGVVQGVGFRPFVYRLAHEGGLAGFIGNDTDGVTIEIEGPAERVDAFLGRLRAETPPLARIDSIAVRDLAATGEAGFRIVASEILGRVSTGIPADAATCADCLRELLDETDRRWRYPFLNCTNCGPRFTITRRIPYRPAADLHGAIQDVRRMPSGIRRSAKPAIPCAAECVLGVRASGLAGGGGWGRNRERKRCGGKRLCECGC